MFAFTSRSKMEADIKAGRYLEHGEYDGNLYGTKIDAIHQVVEAGRLCVLDVNPEVRVWPGGARAHTHVYIRSAPPVLLYHI